MVLTELQHLSSDSLLGQHQAGGGALHQDPGGGAGGGGEGEREGEIVQTAPLGPQPGSRPCGDGEGDQTQPGHTCTH